jgi:predicted PurR-regulated permease PerM
MTIQPSTIDKTQVNVALETSIQIGLAILLTVACLMILRPFVALLSWGIIIAVATYPSFEKLTHALGDRRVLSAVLFTVLLLAFLIAPVVLFAEALVGSIHTLAAHFKDGTPIIPHPPAGVETWPIIGTPLKGLWDRASNDLSEVLRSFAPQIKRIVPSVLSASAGVGLAALQFVLSILVAGFLLANAQGAYEITRSLCIRIFGQGGPGFQQLMGATIRSVTTGILGVALIQTALAGLGFLVAGLPGVGLWTVLFLIAAVLQAGVLILIPAAIYMFAVSSTIKAVIFLFWCVIVGTIDNLLKPLLLGRGVPVPIAVVFLGAIGGFIALGLIGLFIGAVVLAVGYELALAWLRRNSPVTSAH